MKRLTENQKDLLAQREKMAQVALDAYDKGTDATAMQDLITDLLHLAVSNDPRKKREKNAETIACMAWRNFEAEQNGEQV